MTGVAIADSEIIARPAKKIGSADRKRRANILEKTKAHLDSQPKVKVRIRPEDGSQWVQINGYAYRIAASGDYVKVPQQVAEMLRTKGVI